MKFIKRFFLIITVLLLCLLTSGLVLAYFYEDEIGKKAIAELTKQLKVDLQVKKVGLSIFSEFPEAAVSLSGVRLEDKHKKDLLKAETLNFRFGLLSLFGDKIKVNSVSIKEGSLSLHINSSGKENYDIFKSSENTQSDSEFAISLEEADLKNILFRYQDDRSKFKVKTKIEDAKFSGDFSTDQFTLSSDAQLFLHYYQSGTERFLKNRDLAYKAKIGVNLSEKTYNFERVSLELNDNEYILDGYIDNEEKHTFVDLLLTSDNAGLESVLQLLPEQYADYFSDFTSKGKFDFELWIKGKHSQSSKPAIESKFTLKDGEIRSSKLHDPLRKVSFEAHYTNGQYRNAKTSVFEVADFKGVFAGKQFQSALVISDFEDLDVDFSLNGRLPLHSVYGLLDSPLVTDGSGELRIRDFKLEGKYEDMQSMSSIQKVKTTGKLEFEDASLLIKDKVIAIEEGELEINNNSIKVEKVQLNGAGSQLELSGTFFNLMPVIFADSKNTKHAELKFDAELKAKTLDLKQVFDLTEVKETSASHTDEDKRLAVADSLQAKSVQQRQRIANLLKGNFKINADAFSYKKIDGKNFKGNIEFDNNRMNVLGRTESMDGVFDLDGTMYFTNTPYIKAKLICDEVNLKEFFRETENFGQTVLEDKHLDGKVSTKILINAYFDSENNFISDRLTVLAGIGIRNGYLRDFKMLESFSDYVKIEDLRNIKFTTLKNWLEIRKGRIFLPAMFIQSNALNLNLSGEYTFEDDLDFNIKLNAGQVLINSFKKHDSKLRPQADKRNGFFNLHYKIYGNIDNIEYERNRREVNQDLERSEHRRREIRYALRKEFGDLNLFEQPEDKLPELDEAGSLFDTSSTTEEGSGELEYIEGF